MKISRELEAFQARIGYTFSRPDLLVRAMTHSSIATETRPDNQRLEFLGDRVLGLVMAEELMSDDRTAAEGQLAPRFNAMVRKETCADVARSVDLGSVLKLGKSEQVTGGRRKLALLGDGIEALIAAVYVDGGLGPARDLVLRLWGDRIHDVEDDARDAKTTLQEWAQGRKMSPPNYEVVERSGPDHAPVFRIVARLEDGRSAEGEASSKRNAEQAAAQALLKGLNDG
ncbi:ribonuclease III [Jannaschia donghaensis]|uniref:Ribonuclease 3 n=1 Tax=Jannaschia donghaensis TaxID=420998 RepID=A0A0M6YLA2_9RHOB|nr:ribonuclease III [Jannaschia donghaensis]CTQ50057.1 Ribonuclease 3 [Jannaschia donghaensis]